MKILHRMLIAAFLPIFAFSLLFFVTMLQLVDVFANLWRYLAHNVPLVEILRLAFLYTPKCAAYSIPSALLFAIAFSLGNLYKNNELIAILGSGVSLNRLILPYLGLGLILSFGGFLFEDRIVIDTFKARNEMYRSLVQQVATFSNANVTVIGQDIRIVYQVDYYNDQKKTINGVMIVNHDQDGSFRYRIDADWGEWNGRNWVLHNGRIYTWDQGANRLSARTEGIYDRPELSEPPQTFRRVARNMDEMGWKEAKAWVASLRKAGLPYREALTEYYKRFFFALNPLIVALIASGVGGRFKRNVLLMNLLVSLVISVVYFVVQMVALILAKNGYIPPLAGAGVSFILFSIFGAAMLRMART